jgi:hypothetical protein
MRTLPRRVLILTVVTITGGINALAAPAQQAPLVEPMAPIPIQSTRRDTICTMEYRPVCAWRRGRARTYSNACQAERDRATIIHRGKCRGGYREYPRRPWDWWRRDCIRVGPVYVCER